MSTFELTVWFGHWVNKDIPEISPESTVWRSDLVVSSLHRIVNLNSTGHPKNFDRCSTASAWERRDEGKHQRKFHTNCSHIVPGRLQVG